MDTNSIICNDIICSQENNFINTNCNNINFIVMYLRKYEMIKSIKLKVCLNTLDESLCYYKNINICEYMIVIIFFKELYHGTEYYNFYEKLQFVINIWKIKCYDNSFDNNIIILYTIFNNIYNKMVSI